jgi:hypothetical protein
MAVATTAGCSKHYTGYAKCITTWELGRTAHKTHGEECKWHSMTENNLLQDTTVWYDASATNQNIILQNTVISHAIL